MVQIKKEFSEMSSTQKHLMQTMKQQDKQIEEKDKLIQKLSQDQSTQQIELNQIKEEREQELQGQLTEIEKIRIGSEENIKKKDCEIERLNNIISLMQQDLMERANENESLNEENKKYLDMIVKYSLGANPKNGYGGGNKSNRSKLNLLEKQSSIGGKSLFCPSNYARSPLIQQNQKKGTLMKRRAQEHNEIGCFGLLDNDKSDDAKS